MARHVWERMDQGCPAGQARVVSRNNSMRPPLAPLELLDYRSPRDTDIIQEYFVPVDRFLPFMDRFREILVADRANVISATVRYVTANATPALAYAPDRDALAVIQMSNVGLSAGEQARAEAMTRRLVDAALEQGGTYYLTYQLYPTPEQLHRAYPGAGRAFESSGAASCASRGRHPSPRKARRRSDTRSPASRKSFSPF